MGAAPGTCNDLIETSTLSGKAFIIVSPLILYGIEVMALEQFLSNEVAWWADPSGAPGAPQFAPSPPPQLHRGQKVS